MDTRMIENTLTQTSTEQPSRPALLSQFFPANPAIVTQIEDFLEPPSVPSSAPLSFSLTAQPLEQLGRKLQAANTFKSIVKGLPEQFRVRKNDLRFDRNSPAYRKLVAQRFDFTEALNDLEIKFRATGLDTVLITKTVNLCSTIQESIEYADKPGSFSENALTLWVNELLRETETFCDSLDDQYLVPNCGLAVPRKENVIAALDTFTYEQHFNFCLCALAAIENKDYPALTSIAWEFATSFSAKTSGKIEQITEQEFKTQIKNKRELDTRLMQIAVKLFRDTVGLVKAQAWDELLSYIVTIQPAEPVYEEKEREEKHPSGLLQHHMHAASSSSSSSNTNMNTANMSLEQASAYKPG